jgi:hypothetical protein
MAAPLPGDFGCVPVGGTEGRLIRLGEKLNGDAFAQYQHAFVYVGGMVIEAEPGGARSSLHWDRPGALWSTGKIALTMRQRKAVCAAARGYIGTPYSFLDYLALALHRLRIPLPGLRRFIASTGHQICSQLVDQCYADAGIQLFADGRWPGYVTPADLAGLVSGRLA